MPESSELSSRGRTGPLTDVPVLPPHPEDPVGENPCPVGHSAHRIWEDATREALRDSFRLQERMLEKRPGSADFPGWFIELAFGKFQIWAKRNISIVRTDAAARSYEQWLESFMQSWLRLAEEKYSVELGAESLLPELKLQLLQASKYWSGNALESVSAIRNRTDDAVPHSEPAKKEGEPGGAAINRVIGAERVPMTVESLASATNWPDPSPDFTSEEKRNRAMAAYTVAWDCSEASLARTAIVDPADLSRWKKGSLPGGSDKKARIENALRNNDAPTLLAKRSADE
jgi:hypothetical protein